MKRRNFLKITMGTLGSAMGIAAVKADVIGPDITMPTPPEPFEPCGAIKPWYFNPEHSSKLIQPKESFIGVDLASGPDETVYFENLIDPMTMKPIRMKRTKNGWERG